MCIAVLMVAMIQAPEDTYTTSFFAARRLDHFLRARRHVPYFASVR